MKFQIKQTASNVKQQFEIEGEQFFAECAAGSFAKVQPLSLTHKDFSIRGEYRAPRWKDLLPFGYLFFQEKRRYTFELFKNDTPYGKIYLSRHGILKQRYEIRSAGGEQLQAYSVAQGAYHYVPIFLGYKQIALIETCHFTDNRKYLHELFLLDEYADYAHLLCFFALYYANLQFAHRFHMSLGHSGGYQWSLSPYKYMYNPKWREDHFPYRSLFEE